MPSRLTRPAGAGGGTSTKHHSEGACVSEEEREARHLLGKPAISSSPGSRVHDECSAFCNSKACYEQLVQLCDSAGSDLVPQEYGSAKQSLTKLFIIQDVAALHSSLPLGLPCEDRPVLLWTAPHDLRVVKASALLCT